MKISAASVRSFLTGASPYGYTAVKIREWLDSLEGRERDHERTRPTKLSIEKSDIRARPNQELKTRSLEAGR